MTKVQLYKRLRTSVNETFYRDLQTYNNALNATIINNYLNEEYHVVNTFNKCIQDIMINIDKFAINKLEYSNWNFDNKNNKCIKYESENLYLPIYIKCINDNNYINTMAIMDRSKTNKISIIINLVKLNIVKNNKAILAHEFRHLLEMYIDNEKSHINDEIYKISDDELKNHKYFSLAQQIVNLFAHSEEHARLDATIHFLKDENIDTKNIKQMHDKIAYLIDCSKEYHLLYNMQIFINELELRHNIGMYDLIILVGYLWNNYNNKKINILISKENIYNFGENEQKISTKIIEFLNSNYKNFYNKLLDCIYVHLF